LYKAFLKRDGKLISPYKRRQAWSATKKALTEKNAKKGWTSKRIKGRIEMCWNGYHAGTLKGWFGVDSFERFRKDYPDQVLFRVELNEVPSLNSADYWHGQGDGGKWVGRSFTIIKRVV